MFSAASAVEGLANSFLATDSQTSSGYNNTPHRKTKALQTVEKEEAGLSDSEIAEVATLFLSSVDKADTYLAFTNKRAHRIWLDKEVNKMINGCD